MAATASDEVVSKGLTAITGLTQAMGALHNMGVTDIHMFSGLANQIGATRAQLIHQGHDSTHVMALMQGDLQKVWEMQRRHGFAVDETTGKMLQEAEAAGVVGRQHMSANAQMLDATNRMTSAIEFMASRMGYIPQVAGHVAGAVVGAFGTIQHQVDRSTYSIDHWRNRWTGAIRDVAEEADELSFGHSPGGLKEWAIQIMRAMGTMDRFPMHMKERLRQAQQTVDSFGMGGAGLAIAASPSLITGGAKGGMVVNVDARGALFEEESTVATIAGKISNKVAERFYQGHKVGVT